MPGAWSIRVQTALVIALFLRSSAAGLFNAFQALLPPLRMKRMCRPFTDAYSCSGARWGPARLAA